MNGELPELEKHEEGVVIKLWAQPGAKRNCFAGVHQGKLKIAVTQIPEKGKATKEIMTVLARELGIKRSQVTLLSGELSREKRVLVTDMSLAELSALLREKLKT